MVNLEVLDIIIFFSGCIGFAIFMYWLVPYCRQKLFDYKHKALKKRLILGLVKRGISQRSKFRIEVTDGEMNGTSGEGPCDFDLNNTALNIQLTSTFAAQKWEGCNCRIFFQIIQNNKIAFFHFSGVCLRAFRHGDITELRFAMPEQLESGQKRKSLRYLTTKANVFGVGIWHLSLDTPLPTHKSNLKKPIFTYNHKQQNNIWIKDISAGGMRLTISEDEESAIVNKLKPGMPLLGLLMLSAPTLEKKNLTIFVSCRVVSQAYIKKEKLWNIGMRFVAWASMDDSKSDIIWFPNDNNSCVPPLASLVLSWNMNQEKQVH